jgi:endonuclease/exonuclease/phosphatase family metal-dependent hydrolase
MSLETDEGRQAIEDHALANIIVAKDSYSQSDKNKLLELTAKYKWHYLNPPESSLVHLKKIRGRLFRKPRDGPVEVVPDGRDNWVGWFELKPKDLGWQATYNTGRVIREIRPDILITVEVENRPTLGRFNEQVLDAKFSFAYSHGMVIDGNDARGIDLGIFSRFPIIEIRSHVDDPAPNGGLLFSRDCPEFDVALPGGQRLIVVANHLKSKRNGNDQASQDRRQAQAERAHQIAIAALERSPLVMLGGDLNDTPDSPALASLFTGGFQDVMSHSSYPTDRPGTYETGLPSQKLDYLIMSQQLQTKLRATGIERRGSYHPRTWAPFDTVTREVEEASDHHLLWADFDFGA